MNMLQQAYPTDAAFASAAVPIARRPTRLIIGEPVCDWRDSVKDRLGALVQLPIGWDGYSGQPVRFANAFFALRMLETVCASKTPTPQIVPGVSGDLQAEWHTPHYDIELHVRAPNDVIAWRRSAATGVDGEEVTLTNNFVVVANWIEDLERAGAAAAAA